MYETYILQSQINQKYYIGHTQNIGNRISRHNRGLVHSTKTGAPWEVIHLESFETKSEAYRRELEIKSYKGGNAFKRLIGKIQ